MQELNKETPQQNRWEKIFQENPEQREMWESYFHAFRHVLDEQKKAEMLEAYLKEQKREKAKERAEAKTQKKHERQTQEAEQIPNAQTLKKELTEIIREIERNDLTAEQWRKIDRASRYISEILDPRDEGATAKLYAERIQQIEGNPNPYEIPPEVRDIAEGQTQPTGRTINNELTR